MVATLDSTVAMVAICRGVAPTRRIAAKRCSRRAADNRVAAPMNTSTGNSSAAATTDRTMVMPLALVPTGAHSPEQSLGDVVLIRVTWWAPSCSERSATSRPMMMSNVSGPGNASEPMMPTWVPG